MLFLGNRCDANIIADPPNTKGYGTLIMQASYYYMGHFSKHLPRGSIRVGLTNTVIEEKVLNKRLTQCAYTPHCDAHCTLF